MNIEDLYAFIFALIACSTGRFIIYLLNKKRSKKRRRKKDLLPIEIKFLKSRFKIDEQRIDKKSYMLLFSIIDGLIVGLTSICVMKLSDFIYLQMFLGLIIILILIFVIYEIIGRIITRKGEKNEL